MGGVASASPGQLDQTFKSTPGVIYPHVAHPQAIERTSSGVKVAVLADGRMIITGTTQDANNNAVVFAARLMPNGSPDPSFGENGIRRIQATDPRAQIPKSYAVGLALSPTGSILILAQARNELNEPCFGLIQVTHDGQIDTSFGQSGVHRVQPSQAESSGSKESIPTAVAIQPDGNSFKIVALGSASVTGQLTESVAVRFHQDGSLDTDFALGGVARIRHRPNITSGRSFTYAAAVAPDGSIIIVGQCGTEATELRATVARLSPIGKLDREFSTRSEQTQAETIVRNPTAARAVTIASDGKIIVTMQGHGRQNDERIFLARHMPDGTLDRTFSIEGIYSTQLAKRSSVIDVKLCPDGRIVVGAAAGTPDGEALRFLRLSRDGARDESFGTDGVVSLQSCNPGPHCQSSTLLSMAVAPDGTIIGTGHAINEHNQYGCIVVRLLRDGSLDTSLGKGGIAKAQTAQLVPRGRSFAETATRQPDGKFVLAGNATDANGDLVWAVTRFSANGMPDASFGHNGAIRIDAKHPKATPDPYARATTVVIDPSDGKIIVAGNTKGPRNEGCIAVARLLADGKIDPTFGSAGITRIQTGPPQEAQSRMDWPEAMGLQSDGKIIIVGTTKRGEQSNLVIASLHPDGTQNQAFGQAGVTTVDASHAKAQEKTSNARAITVLGDNSFIVGGNSSDHFNHPCATVAHFTAGGSLQPRFGTNGIARMQPQIVTNPQVIVSSMTNSVAIQMHNSEMKIVTAGISTSPEGYQVPTITRFTSSGKIDTTFGNQGTTTYHSTAYPRGFAYAIDATSNRIIASGAVISAAGALTDAVWALTADGQADTTFGDNGTAIVELRPGDPGPRRPMVDKVFVLNDKIVVALNRPDRRNMPCMAVAALNTVGQTLRSFGADSGMTGIDASFTKTQPERSGASATIVDREGKVIAAGTATDAYGNPCMAITRFHPTGEIDLSFANKGTLRIQASPPGTSKPSSAVRAVALQEDGKIVVTGTAKSGDGTDTIAVARLSPEGAIDTSFSRTGVVLPQAPGKHPNLKWSMGNAIAAQTDRSRRTEPKIIVAGVATDPHGKRCFVVMRLLSNGQLDSEFAPRTTAHKRRLPADEQPSPASYVNNIAYIQASTASFSKFSEATSLIVQPDQKIVVAGRARDAASAPAMALIRLQPNGTLDPSFGTNGIVLHQASRTQTAPRRPFRLPSGNTLPVPPDPDPAPTGHLDQGPTGAKCATAHALVDEHQGRYFDGRNPLDHNSPQDSEINSITIMPGGRIIAAGSAKSPAGEIEMAIAQFMPDGSLDTTFGNGGTIHVQASSDPSLKISRALGVTTHQGKIVATGIARDNGRICSATLRLHPSGQLDESFGAKGLALIQAAPGTTSQDQTFTPALVRPDNRTNKIVLAGTTTNADGTSELTLIRLET